MFCWLRKKEVGKWIKVYDLKKDTRKIKLVQEAALNTRDYGIRPDIALFGSKKWWEAIESGLIPKRELNGKISRVYMSGHNDYPEFEAECESEKTQWTRESQNMDEYYQVGRNVKIEYVVEKLKRDFGTGLETKSVLAIYVEQNHDSNSQ